MVPAPRGTRRIDGGRVRFLRGTRRWTQRDLANASGVPRRTVQRVELGEHTVSYKNTIEALAAALGTTVDDVAPILGTALQPADRPLPVVKCR